MRFISLSLLRSTAMRLNLVLKGNLLTWQSNCSCEPDFFQYVVRAHGKFGYFLHRGIEVAFIFVITSGYISNNAHKSNFLIVKSLMFVSIMLV